MMNKKLVGTALVGLMTVGFAGQVLAAQTSNGDGTSNVTEQTDGKMEVRGNLGKIDNTDPETPLPDGDEKWINVTFPTATIFGTDDSETITSPNNYGIRNNSGRDVKVEIADYVIDGGNGQAALKELNIVSSQGESVLLAQDGTAAVTQKEDFAVIDSKQTTKFSFTGAIDKEKLTGTKDFVESHVVFQFTSLPKSN